MATKSIFIIDSRVADYQRLVADLPAESQAFVLNADQDGIAQMQAILSNFNNLDSVQIVSHGAQGVLYLGSTVLNQENIGNYRNPLGMIGNSLAPTGDLLLYGCNVAQGDEGQQFIERLAQLTGADVAASNDATGNTVWGGDWDLEAAAGTVETVPQALAYEGGLGLTVSTPISDTRINTYTASYQSDSTMVVLSNGEFVITWRSYFQDGSDWGIFGQRYDANGNAQGDEFRVNTYTADSQSENAVAALTTGGFVVTWNSRSQDGSDWGVYGQRYDSNGNAEGTEFRINTNAADIQANSSVAALPDGGFVVTWDSYNQDGSDGGVYAQRYDINGITDGAEFRINSYTANNQVLSSVAALTGGGFVVTWQSFSQDGAGWGIYGQRYDANGIAQGTEFRVNSHTASDQLWPSVAALTNDGFVVTWQSLSQDGSGYGIYGQRYDASGNTVGAEFLINAYTTNNQENPWVTALDDGGFVVFWESLGQDGSGDGIYGQRYNASGVAQGAEFLVNTHTADTQIVPSATGLADGGFAVTWMSFNQDGSASGIFGKRYDANGNEVEWISSYNNNGYQITPSAPVVSEATADTIEFTITRPTDRLGIAETVYVSTTQNHGSVNTNDYVGLLNIPYPFAEGEASKTVVVDILSDSIAEADETFGLIVQTNATDPLSTFLASTTFTITENTLPPINQPPTAQPVSSTKSLQPGKSIALSELFTWSDPDGIADVVSFAVRDRDVGGGYLTKNGIRLQDDQLFDNVPIAEIANWAFVAGEADSADEVAFNVIDAVGAFSTPSAVSTVSATSPTSTNTWQIGPIASTVSETDGVIDFIITRPDDQLSVEETVFFYTAGLNGIVNDSDFLGPNPSYTFGVGEKTSLPISVNILSDSIYDPNEVFDLIVKNSSDALLTSTNFTIQDAPFNPENLSVIYLDFKNQIPRHFYFADNGRFVVEDGSMPLGRFSDTQKAELVQRVQAIFDRSDIRVFVTDIDPTPANIDFHTARFTSEVLFYDPDGNNEGNYRRGEAYEGIDRFNVDKNNMVAILQDGDNSAVSDIAETVAHEIGHAFGARHINPDESSGQEVMDTQSHDFPSFVKNPVDIKEVVLGQEASIGGTHNPSYHLRRYVVGEDDATLKAGDIKPGSWDEGSIKKIWYEIKFELSDAIQPFIGQMGTLGTLLRGETNLLESNDNSFNTINVLAKNVKQGDKIEFALAAGTEFQIVASTQGNATFNMAFKFEGATSDSFVITAGDQRELSGTILVWESSNELPIQVGTVSATIIQETIVNPDGTENIVPVTNDNEFFSDEDSVFTGNVLTDDFDGDNDVLSITVFDTTGTLGLVTDNGDGTFNYDPNGAFDYLNAGESATDSFTYTASDGNGGSDTATVTITINGVDDLPNLNPITGTSVSDYLTGTAAADIIYSLGGSYDKSSGGLGGDIFAFGAEALNGIRERDVILDYEVGMDSILLKDGAAVGSIRQTSTGVTVFLQGDGDAIYVQGVGVLPGNLTFAPENIVIA